MMRKLMVPLLVAFAFVVGIPVVNAQFTDGNLVLFRNTSASALVTTGTAIVLDEYLPNTASQSSTVSSVALPFTASAGSNGIVAGGTTSSNGAISRSENGRYILVPGWSTNTSISGNTCAVGAANTTNIYCGIRPVNGSGTVGTGITGTSNWFTAANDYRGATSDDGTNFWVSGATLGIRTTTNGTTLTTVSTYNSGNGTATANTGSTNTRAVNIINGQLYYSTGSQINGVYQVGIGKPTTAGSSSVNIATIVNNTSATSTTGAYGYSISPDFLTLYTNSATGAISRITYSGTYNSGAYSGGTWSSASTGITLTAATGVAVDWSGYSFSTGANGAIIYACNSTTLVRGSDNGTGAITTTTLATLTGNNAFKQIAFAPIKQSLSLGANTPATANITKGTTQNVLFQFKVTADEGKSTVKKIILTNTGTAVLNTDITNIKLVVDANNNGVADASEISAATTTAASISSNTITFSGLSLGTYLTETSSYNFLVIGDVVSGATTGNTFIPKISKTTTLNSQDYTTNIVNAGGSYVFCPTGGITGNTLTVAAPAAALTPYTLLSSLSNVTGTPSTGIAFTAAGTNLSTTITVTPQTGYEIATSLNGTYQNTAMTGVANNTTLYVRIAASVAAGNYNSATCVVLSGGGASSSVNVTTSASGNTVSSLSPTLTASTLGSALTNTYGTASTGVSFVAAGTNLSTTITVTPQTGYEIATSLGGTYQSSAMTGVANNTTLYVRIAATVAAGTYDGATCVVLSGGGAASSVNITTAASGNNVSIKTLTISGVTASNKTYDATTTATLNTGSAALSATANGDVITLSSVSATATFASASVASGVSVTCTGFSISGTNSANYTLTQPTCSANITVAPLTITAADQSKVVGTTLTTGTGSSLFSVSGLVGSEAITSITIASTGAASGATTGTYSIVPSAAVFSTGTASNYNISYTNGTLTVAAALTITPGGAAYTQNFDAIGTSSTAATPAGWKVDNTENTTGNFRTVSVSYASATTSCTQVQPASGASCQSTNGIWNNVSTSTASDRAIGFLSSSASSRNCNWYVQLQNASGTKTINSFNISYNIEKYRNNGNPTAFTVQLYYSTNGTSWTSAGSNFLYTSTIDGNTNCPLASTLGTLPSATSAFSNTFTPASPVAANATIYFAWNYCVASGTTTSNSPLLALDDVSITANTTPIFTASPSSSTATYCQNASATALSVTATNGGSAITKYEWYSNLSNSNSGGTLVATHTTSALTDTYTPSTSAGSLLYYYCLVTNGLGTTTSSVSGLVTVTANVTPSVTLSTNTGASICANTSVTFTPTPTNGGTPSYLWYKNGVSTGVTTGTYTNASLVNNDNVYVVMTPSGICVSPATAQSANYTMTVTGSVTPTVSISPSTSQSICTGTTVSFTSSLASAGTANPDWYVNGSLVASNVATYDYTPGSAGSYTVQAKLTSNAGGCVIATTQNSNTTTVSVATPSIVPTVSISTASSTTVCFGNSLSFTSSVANNGTVQPDWFVDGSLVTSNSSTYTLTTPAVGSHTVQAKLTSDAGGCVVTSQQSSSTTNITVNASLAPSVSVAASATTVCTGTSVTFTATPTNGGNTPVYTWYKGGNVLSGETSATYTLATPLNNDAVYAVLTPSADVCASPSTATSSTTTLTVNSTFPTVAITANHLVHYSAQNDTFTVATSGSGYTVASYQWTKNGTPIVGATATTYATPSSVFANNDVVNCTVTATNTCAANATSAATVLVPTPRAFAAGNLTIFRYGKGDTLSNFANRVFIDEYTTSGTFVQSVPMPYSKGVYPQDANYSLTGSAVATSEGYMTLASDGTYLSVPGYNVYEGASGVASTATNATNKNNYRVIGKVDYSGTPSVPLAANFLSGNNIRGVASDGTRIWGLGAAGFFYFNNYADTSGTQYSGINARTLQIFNGKLWGASASAGITGINYFGNISSLRDNGALSTTLVTDSTGYFSKLGTSTASPYGYTFNPTGDTLYVADDGNNLGGNAGGILKYYYNSSLGKYSLLGRISTIRARSIVGDFSGTKPVLYFTSNGSPFPTATSFNFTQDSIMKLVDNGGITAPTITLLAQAPTWNIWRGITWAPAATQTPYTFVSKQYHGATFNSSFPTTIANVASTNTGNNYFAVAGKFIGSNGVTITPPQGFEISTSSSFSSVYTNSSPYTVSQQDMFDTSTRSIQVIYVRFKPTVGGSYTGNIQITTTGGVTSTVSVSGYCSTPVSYYVKNNISSSNLLNTASWTNSATLNGGTSPASMSDNNIIWNLTGNEGTLTLGTDWILGANSSIVIGGGSSSMKLVVPSNYTINTTTNGGLGIGLASNGTLDWQGASIPVLTSIASGSSINYTGSVAQTLAQATYSNISLSGAGAKTITGTIAIDNNFSVTKGTDVSAANGSTVTFNGSTAQTVPGFNYYNLTLSNPAGCNASGVDSVYGTTYIEEGTYTIPSGSSFFMVGAASSLSMYSSSQQLVVNGTFIDSTSLGTAFTSFNGGKVSFGAGSIYNHKINGGSIPTATWNATSTCNVTGITSTALLSGFATTFGNFTWNCPGQTVIQGINSSSFSTAAAFTVAATNTGSVALINSLSNTVNNTFGSVVVSGGTLYGTYRTSATTPVANITVGDVTVSGTGIFDLANGASATATTPTYTTNLYVNGNITVGSAAKFYGGYSANSNIRGLVTFQKSGTQTLNDSATKANSTNIDYVINSGTVLQLNYSLTQTARTTSTTSATDKITNNGKIDLNGKTLSLNTITGSGLIKGSSTSSLSIDGTYSNSLSLDQSTLGVTNTLNSLTIATTGTVTLSNALNITGILTSSSGTFAMGNSLLTIKSTSITNSAVLAPVLGTITGTATVERFIPKGFRSYRDLSAGGVYSASNYLFNTWQESGSYAKKGYGIFITGKLDTTIKHNVVDGTTGLDHSLTGSPSAFYYKAGWDTIRNTKTELLNPYQSYRVLVRGDRSFDLDTTPVMAIAGPLVLAMNGSTTLEATGNLIFGNVVYSRNGVSNAISNPTYNSATYGLNPSSNSYTYIANPYACPIDFKHIYNNGGLVNVQPYYYYLDPTIGSAGAWVVYNAQSNVSTKWGLNHNGEFIQAGQGFLIKDTSSGAPVLTITEADKSILSSSKTSVFGTTNSNSGLTINLMKQSGSNYLKMDAAVAVFGSQFNNGIGVEDAGKMSNASDNLAIVEANKSLSIDGRLPATSSDVIPISLSQLSGTNYQLVINSSDYVRNGVAPFIKDAYTNKTTALSSGVDTIAFTADSKVAASYQNRFSVVFKPTTLSVNSIVATATANGNTATIIWNTVGEKGIAKFEVEKSADGTSFAKIGEESAKNTASASYIATDNIATAATNYYRIKAISTDGTVTYSNIAKVTYNLQPTTYNLYPNPLTGKTLNVQLGNVVAGKYVVSITNTLGQKVTEQAINHAGGNGTHAIGFGKAIAAGIYNVSILSQESKQTIHSSTLTVN